MTNNSQSPREYDAVLGGNSPPPIYGAVLGGIEGLNRRLETGNTQQRVDSLADAIKYGDAGIDLLIEALDDEEIEIRAKAFQLLQNIDSKKVSSIDTLVNHPLLIDVSHILIGTKEILI